MKRDLRGSSSLKELAWRFRHAEGEELSLLIEANANDARSSVQALVSRGKKRLLFEEAEKARVAALYERAYELGGSGFVLGVDEVGRGAIAGPLTVAAVSLPKNPQIQGLNDSKQLTGRRREVVASAVREVALTIGVAHVSAPQIDAHGMAWALRQAVTSAIKRAVDPVGIEPDAVLIDGCALHVHPKELCVIKGDATVAPIAAASIVAKVARDAILTRADAVWRGYHFDTCKGYGSSAHRCAIQELGLTPYHRASFCRRVLSLREDARERS